MRGKKRRGEERILENFSMIDDEVIMLHPCCCFVTQLTLYITYV